MVNKRFVWVAVLVMVTLSSLASASIKGNGTMMTKEIKVSEYTSIRMGGNISTSFGNMVKSLFSGENKDSATPIFIYTQKAGSPTVKVTIDSNLYDYLDIHVENRQLVVGTKNNKQLNPTRYEIRSHSASLNEVKVGGSSDFRIDGQLTTNALTLKVSGSGSIRAKENVKSGTINAGVSGSGNLYLTNLLTNDLEVRISGSGNANLGGSSQRGDFAVSGSGNVNAYDCRINELSCSVSGSGDMKVQALKRLKASVSGSGDVAYKGTPAVDIHTSGSGSIHQVN